jgi:hypothetical protein
LPGESDRRAPVVGHVEVVGVGPLLVLGGVDGSDGDLHAQALEPLDVHVDDRGDLGGAVLEQDLEGEGLAGGVAQDPVVATVQPASASLSSARATLARLRSEPSLAGSA